MGHETQGTISTVISGVTAFIAIVDIHAYISITAGLIAIIAGCMAIRHNYYATKKIKKETNKNYE